MGLVPFEGVDELLGGEVPQLQLVAAAVCASEDVLAAYVDAISTDLGPADRADDRRLPQIPDMHLNSRTLTF